MIVLKFNPKTQKGTPIDTTERSMAIEKYMKNSDEYRIVSADISKFNHNFREIKPKQKNQSFLSFLTIKKATIDVVVNVIKIVSKSIFANMAKIIKGIIIAFIAGILILIIWDIYSEQLIEYFLNIIDNLKP